MSRFAQRMRVAGAMMISAVFSANVGAQQGTVGIADVTGASVQECNADAKRWYDQSYKASTDSAAAGTARPLDFRAIVARRREQLGNCVLKLDANSLHGEEALALARALADARGYDRALETTRRYLKESVSSDSARAVVLQSMINRIRETDITSVREAEPYVSMIDALPRTFVIPKIAAHESVFRTYQTIEDDSNVHKHATAIIALARNVKAHVKTKEAPAIPPDKVDAGLLLVTYMSAAIVDGNFGRESQGAKLLDQGRREHPEIDAKYFDAIATPILTRSALIGKPARGIASTRWFNAPAGTSAFDFSGRVTLLGFTAHWCQPCHLTYAPMQTIADSLGPKGVQVAFVTEFFGYVGGKRGLNEQQEMDATRAYYEARKIRFPIAMLGEPVLEKNPTRAIGGAFLEYGIQQIPQTVIIDRKGIVRRILVGWDPANSERIPAYLHALLREK
ncbi:MAG: TlpA family protein disulfide reductase [Gemmatimonas sp.]